MNNVRRSATTPALSECSGLPPGSSDAHDTIVPCSSPSTRQQRLLKLRNDNFSAKQSLSGAVVNSRLSGLTAENGSPPQRNQENIGLSGPKVPNRKYHTTSTLGIFADISNSVRSASLGGRERDRLGRQAIPIFHDTPERALLEPSPEASPPVYQNASSSPVDSPFRFENIQDSFAMGLREVSGNVRKSPLADSSPWTTKSIKRRQATQSSRFNSEEYIHRIEKELELAHNSVYSPNSNRSWKDKLRQAEAENERLRQELADVKTTFESEVQNAVQHKTAAELILRRKIRDLEDEVEQKNNALRDVQTQRDDNRPDQGVFDTLKATIERLEAENHSLEQSNQSMSKRNEVLSHLLALSPTKQATFELEQPRRLSKSQRPQSLLIPRVASSPTHTHPQRPRSLIGSPVPISATGSSSGLYSPSSPLSPDHHARALQRPELTRSRSSQTGERSHSRSSTLASYMSHSPTSSEQISASSSVDPSSRANANRRRRRMHGSTQLKPLLLPTLTGDFGALSTTPICSPIREPTRDFSNASIDPTTMFLSQSPTGYEFDESNPLSDPYAVAISRTSARSLAYQSLEGILDANNHNTGRMTDVDESYFNQISEAARNRSAAFSPRYSYALEGLKSPRSMCSGEEGDRTLLPSTRDTEDHESDVSEQPGKMVLYSSPEGATAADVPEPLFSTSTRFATVEDDQDSLALSTHDDIDNHGLPVLSTNSRKRRKLSSCSQDYGKDNFVATSYINESVGMATASKGVDKGIDARSLGGTETPAVRSRPTSMCLLSPRQSRTPLEILHRKNFGVKPIAVVTIKTIYGTLSKCTTMMRDFRRDPLAVARKVIANAWRCNWAVLGKLSWWVLGLFLGHSTKRQEETWDWDDYDAEAIAERQCQESHDDGDDPQKPLLRQRSRESQPRRVRFDAGEEEGPSLNTSQNKPAPGWGKTVMLWGKFSMAIMLAVGGAVVKGPGEMLKETDVRAASSRSRDHRRVSIASNDDAEGDVSTTSVELQPVSSPSSVTSEMRNRRPSKQVLCSPPPSAKSLLSKEPDAEHFPSSPPVSSSPSVGSFRFGRGQRFDFTMDDEIILDADFETLKPRKSPRTRIQHIFDESNAGSPKERNRSGQQEYDPASAGFVPFDSIPSTPDSLKDFDPTRHG